MIIRRGFSIAIITLPLLVSSFLSCALAFAQQPTPEPPPSDVKNQPAQDQPDNSNSGDNSPSVDHSVIVTTTEPPIRQTTSAGFLMPSISPLRWGPVYVGFAQFAEIFEQGNSLNGAGNQNVIGSQFSAGIVFDKRFGNGRLVVQYTPRITIVNGEVYTNFVNQDMGIDWVFPLTPRLSLDLSNHFVYYNSNDYFANMLLSGDPSSGVLLSGDSSSGLTLQKDFIRAPGTWLSNSTTAAFTYALSERTRITIAPYYLYAHSSGQVAASQPPTVNEYSLNVVVAHNLTAHSVMSFTYLDQTDVYPSDSSSTTFQTLQAGYSYSSKYGWNFSGSIGFTTAGFQSGRTWSASGNLSAVKRFRRSQATIAYTRGHSFAGYISQGLSDRFDANYQQYIGRRWTFGGGVGYFRDAGTGNGLRGKYGEGNLSFGLSPTVSLYGSYVYQWQTSNSNVVFSGSTNYIRCGMQWMPHQAAHQR